MSKSHRIPYSWQRKPLLPEMKLLMKDFGFKNTTPRIGTSDGRLRDFSSELTKNYPPQIGTSHRGLRDFCSELLKITPPPNLEFSWRTVNGTGLWRLITVSNVDNILSVIEGRACTRFTQK